MSSTHALAHLLGGLVLLAAIGVARAASASGDAKLRADLEAVSHRTIYFGHQSVGGNIIDGMRQLAAQEGVPLRFLETQAAAGIPPGTCVHGLIGENGSPLLKIQGFERALEATAGVDVAFMKFCYVDFHQGTDVPALFSRYQAALRDLQKKHPRTAFVHVTTPLTTVQGGPKALLKRLLGRETSEVQNARREQFNALVRKAYLGREPLFDLARIESTAPDGRIETIEWKGQAVPVLVSAYTDDGGHLNAEGQRRVARALVALLASLPANQGGVGTAAVR